MLLGSAIATFMLDDPLRSMVHAGELAPWMMMAAPAVFTLFVLVYLIDRWLVVRHRSYSPARALFQVAFAAEFLTALVPSKLTEFQKLRAEGRPLVQPLGLLGHQDPSVRALACEVLAARDVGAYRDKLILMVQRDGSPHVREACKLAVERFAARDLRHDEQVSSPR